MRVCVFHLGLGYGNPAGHVARALTRHGEALRGEGIVVHMFGGVDDAARVACVRELRPEVVLDFRHWAEPSERIRLAVEEMRSACPGLRYVLMDTYDSTASPHFGLMDDVDVYAKRQVLSDASAYDRAYAGGYVFTDFLVRQMGFDIGDWSFGERVSGERARRVAPIWNIGAVGRYERLAGVVRTPWRLRPIGLNVRIGLGRAGAKDEWYQQYRRLCLERVERLRGRMRLSGTGRLSSRWYSAELAMSRAVFSPFGWGEVCFRDFEAVACGCVLLKQDMSHLSTEPDIYRAMETYVPVRWDLEDLEERAAWIQSHPKEAAEIARCGQRTLAAYFRQGGALPTMRRLLERATERVGQGV